MSVKNPDSGVFPLVVKNKVTDDRGVGVLIDRNRLKEKEPNAFFINFKKCRVYGNSTENVIANALDADVESCEGGRKTRRSKNGSTNGFGATPVNPSGVNPMRAITTLKGLAKRSRKKDATPPASTPPQSRRPSVSSTQSAQTRPRWNPSTNPRRASFGGSRKTRKLQQRAKTFRKHSSRK